LVVRSTCWTYLLAQVTSAVRELVRRFRYLLCASLPLRIPAPWPVAWCMLNLLTGCQLTVYLLAVYTYWLSILTGCLLRMLDPLTSSGNLRSARIGTALSLPAVLAYPCTCPHLGSAQHMLDLLTSSGNHRNARIGTALSLPAVLAYPCACLHLGSAQRMLDLLTSLGNHRSAQVYYR
jgi:hypothetical protein